MKIRPLDPDRDMGAVAAFYAATPDYWLLAEGRVPDRGKAAEFFTDGPPGCDPAISDRLGVYLGSRLSGLVEISYGFPAPGDAYLGLLILGPWARGQGIGRAVLAEVEDLARTRDAPMLYLAVIEANMRGFSFWRREGFIGTGVTGTTKAGDVVHKLHRLAKPL